MMKDSSIRIEKYTSFPGNLRVELVERKGLGHPDNIADAIAEEFSINLSKKYLENHGRILHHNVDKLELVAGSSQVNFGGGRILEPVTVVFSGRASKTKEIDIDSIAKSSAQKVFSIVAPKLLNHLDFIIKTKPGSIDLVKNFESSEKIPRSNDTSFGSGFWPMTPLEEFVIGTEKYLRKKHDKFYGNDIKVMGLRDGKKVILTIAIAMLAEKINNEREYLQLKEELKNELNNFIKENISQKNLDGYKINVEINTADDKKKGIYYLTLSGTSLEAGDDGAVGRGNRLNGIITPFRNMSLEAYAGKNPINHIGKLYNYAAIELSKKIYEITGSECEAILLAQIGKPINEPYTKIMIRDKSKANEVKKITKKYFSEEFIGISERIIKKNPFLD